MLRPSSWFFASGAVLLFSQQADASDSCDPPSALVAQADRAVVEGRFTDMPDLLQRFDDALACAEQVDVRTLAAFFRAEGAWFALTGLETESDLAFRSAARLAPNEWTAAFGIGLQDRFNMSSSGRAGAPGSIRLAPLPDDPTLQLYIDGRTASAHATVDPGLHALQLVRPPDSVVRPGEARFGRVVAVFPGENVVVNPGMLPPEKAPQGPLSANTDRPAWALGAGGCAVVVAGLTASMARRQGGLAIDSTSMAEVNTLERRQRALAWTSYSFMGLGAVGASLYFAL